MMATPLSMMALWNKPFAMGDRIWNENTGDQEKSGRGLPIHYTHHPSFFKETFPGSLLKSSTHTGEKKKPWFGDSRTSHESLGKLLNLFEPQTPGTLRSNILVCECQLLHFLAGEPQASLLYISEHQSIPCKTGRKNGAHITELFCRAEVTNTEGFARCLVKYYTLWKWRLSSYM